MSANTFPGLPEIARALYQYHEPAIRQVSYDGGVNAMVLMAPGCCTQEYYNLTRQNDPDGDFFTLSDWQHNRRLEIEADGRVSDAALARWAFEVLGRVVPIARNGSLFGWRPRGWVDGLISVHTHPAPSTPAVDFAILLESGLPRTEWPDFAEAKRLSNWFWNALSRGDLVDLSAHMRYRQRRAYFVPLPTVDVVAVRDHIEVDNLRVPRGVYVPVGAKLDHVEIPVLPLLLSRRNKTDLARRFRQK